MAKRESDVPTPYATHCHYGCGLVYMTREFYDAQMGVADSGWVCARCMQSASWDDEIYEQQFLEKE